MIFLNRLSLLLELIFFGNYGGHVPLQSRQSSLHLHDARQVVAELFRRLNNADLVLNPADGLLRLNVKGLHSECGIQVVALLVDHTAKIRPLGVELIDPLLDLGLTGGQVSGNGLICRAVDRVLNAAHIQVLSGGSERLLLLLHVHQLSGKLVHHGHFWRVRVHLSFETVKAVLDHLKCLDVLDNCRVQCGQEALLLVNPLLHIVRVTLQPNVRELLVELLFAQLEHVRQLTVASVECLESLLHLVGKCGGLVRLLETRQVACLLVDIVHDGLVLVKVLVKVLVLLEQIEDGDFVLAKRLVIRGRLREHSTQLKQVRVDVFAVHEELLGLVEVVQALLFVADEGSQSGPLFVKSAKSLADLFVAVVLDLDELACFVRQALVLSVAMRCHLVFDNVRLE